jgi:hypothetical protein
MIAGQNSDPDACPVVTAPRPRLSALSHRDVPAGRVHGQPRGGDAACVDKAARPRGGAGTALPGRAVTQDLASRSPRQPGDQEPGLAVSRLTVPPTHVGPAPASAAYWPLASIQPAVDRHAAVRNPGHRTLSAVRLCQRVVVDQSHIVACGPGSCGLRREVLVRAAGTKQIRRHKEQHQAGMSKRRRYLPPKSPAGTAFPIRRNRGYECPLRVPAGAHGEESRNPLLERRCRLLGACVSACPGNPRLVPAWLRPSGYAPTAVRSCRMSLPACARTAACPPGD